MSAACEAAVDKSFVVDDCDLSFSFSTPRLSRSLYQLLRLQARSQPAGLDHGHGHRQQQRRARGVAGGVDRAGDAGDGGVLPPQHCVGGRDGAPELRDGLLHALSLAGAEARDDDGLAAERERGRGGRDGHFVFLNWTFLGAFESGLLSLSLPLSISISGLARARAGGVQRRGAS